VTGSRPPLIGRLLLKLRRLRDRRDDVEADYLELYRVRAARQGRRAAGWSYLADVLSLWMHRRPGGLARARPTRRLNGVTQDVVFAIRIFRRQPAVFAVSAAGLALAIGMTTSVFSIVNAVTLRDLGVVAPKSFYRLETGTGANSSTPWSHDDYARLTHMSLPVSLAATSWYVGAVGPAQPRTSGELDRLPFTSITAVSGSYFPLLGVRATVGRTLIESDDAGGASRVAVLSFMFWKTRLGSDQSVLGKTIRIQMAGGDMPVTVVGVAPRGFDGLEATQGPPAAWMTLTAITEAVRELNAMNLSARRARIAALKSKQALTEGEREGLRTLEAGLGSTGMPVNFYVRLFARLEVARSRAQAEGSLTALATALAIERGQREAAARPLVRLESIGTPRAAGVLGIALPILLGAMGLVVALACANVTNLLLASASTRQREIGTRLAIGASRARIVRQLLTESVLLALAAGAAGFMLAQWLTPGLATWFRLPALVDLQPDSTVYLFVTVTALAAGLVAGLAPAREARNADLMTALKSDTLAMRRPPRTRLRSMLIGGQAAGSVVLLVLTALLTRSVIKVSTENLGLDVDHLVTFQGLGRGYDTARSRAFWNVALDRVRSLERVSGAALTMSAPFSSYGPLRLRDGRLTQWHKNSPEYFETVGIPLLRGRTFSAEENETDAPVVVISASLARAFWWDEEPLGSTLDRIWPEGRGVSQAIGSSLAKKLANARVVGIAGDATSMLAAYDWPSVYLPLSASDTSLVNATLVARTRTDPLALAGPIAETLGRIDPELQHTPRLVRDSFHRELEHPKRLATLAAIVGVASLGLAVVGLFGVTAFVAGCRRHEIGVRLALGAHPAAILRMLLGDSLKPVAIGLTCGVVAAFAGGRVVSSTLYGVSAHDPIAVMAAVAALLGAALAAVIVPVRRAAAVDPALVLRQL
jgi:putative ABC transport system permease protein